MPHVSRSAAAAGNGRGPSEAATGSRWLFGVQVGLCGHFRRAFGILRPGGVEVARAHATCTPASTSDAAALVPDAAGSAPDAVALVPDAAALAPDAVAFVPDAAGFVPDTVAFVPDTAALVLHAAASRVLQSPNTSPPAA
jgi:hypothetical protein